MFFQFNEKTLKDAIENQRKREKEEKPHKPAQPAPDLEYEGHVLTIVRGADGSTLIDSNPPLTKVLKVEPFDETNPPGEVDTFTPLGWVRKK
jgi:hypothetical protein